MIDSPSISLIIPAAGLSRRHPPNKLLLPLEGETVIQRSVARFIEAPCEILVILGHQAERLERCLSECYGDRVRLVRNPRYREGLASSLRAGILAARGEADYLAFCGGDRPFIRHDTVIRLFDRVAELRPRILRPVCEGRPGQPCFFSAEFRSELLELEGDTGGRRVLERHAEETLEVEVEDRGTVRDMDRYLEERAEAAGRG